MHYLLGMQDFESELKLLKKEYDETSFIYDGLDAPSDKPITQFFRYYERASYHGIYVIRSDETNEVLYIGKGGTLKSDGEFKAQGVYKRLKARRGQQRAQEWLFDMLSEFGTLRIECVFLEKRLTPALAEALLLQAFYNDTGKLPNRNKAL